MENEYTEVTIDTIQYHGYEKLSHANIQYWYIDGFFHREDGPAIIHPNGTKKILAEWFRGH